MVKIHEKELNKKSIDYFEYSFNDFLKLKYKIKFLNQVKNINNDYDIIIISSFEHLEKIKKKFNKVFKNTKIFSIYDNCSRSIMDAYLIKKNKGRKKIYNSGIYQKL